MAVSESDSPSSAARRRADPAVHHVAGGDHVGPRSRVDHGGPRQDLEGGVVVDFEVTPLVLAENAAMPVIGVLVDADVGDDQELGGGLFHGGDGARHRAVGVAAPTFRWRLWSWGARRGCTPPRPSDTASRALAAAAFTGSCNTPGMVPIGRGSSMVAEKNSGKMRSPESSEVSRAKARMAGVRRRRRGRATGKGIALRDSTPEEARGRRVRSAAFGPTRAQRGTFS